MPLFRVLCNIRIKSKHEQQPEKIKPDKNKRMKQV